MNDIERIYHQWHEYAKGRDTAALIGLYAEDAVFESPLVPVIMQTDSGVLRGRPQILAFLEEGTRRRPNELVRWYRTGQYLVAGDTLVWEYPRQTPDGDQVDILELMQVHDGLIRHHRIYWGWFGTQMLIASAVTKAEPGSSQAGCMTMPDQRPFELNDEDHEAFLSALDNPPEPGPRLRTLMQRTPRR